MRRVGCRWVRQRKWRYLDGTLPAPQKRLVEAHLQACIPCRAALAQAQDALQALTAGKPLTPEQQRALRRPKSALTPIRVAAVAILALLLGGAGYLWRTQGDTLMERLAARGAAPAATVESERAEPSSASMEAAHAEPSPSESVPAVPVETSPIEPPPVAPKPAEVAPKPAETPPRAAAPAPPRRPSSPQTRPVSPPQRTSPPPKQATAPAPPPEGTVEVYDAAGNLIQRKQLQEKR